MASARAGDEAASLAAAGGRDDPSPVAAVREGDEASSFAAAREGAPSQILALTGADRDAIQSCLGHAAHAFAAAGWHVIGVVEELQPDGTQVLLRDLATGATQKLTQDLGPGSAGCSLDPAGLAAACAGVEAAIAALGDGTGNGAAPGPMVGPGHPAGSGQTARPGNVIVILSKFGRQEAEGRGLTHAFHAAVAAELPVLTSVSPVVTATWATFAGPLATFAPPDAAAIGAWRDGLAGMREAIEDAGVSLGAASH